MNENSNQSTSQPTDQRIGHVLAALRDIAPPTGMERRILEAVQHRVAEPASSWHRLQTRIRPARWAVALASIVAVIVASLTLLQRSTRSNPQHVSTAPRTQATGAFATKPQPAATAMYTAPRSHGRRVAVSSQADAYDLLALDETRAPSHPAPPMPLTEQEKLMLRIVHRNDPVELAELDPAQRSAEQDEEKQSFQNFFEPAPSKTGDSE